MGGYQGELGRLHAECSGGRLDIRVGEQFGQPGQ
jgi:hypothetical protein